MREFLERINWKKTIVLIILSIAIAVLYLVVNGFEQLFNYIDAFFISGFTIICFGALSLVAYYGAFDMFGYSSYYLKASIQKTTERKYENYKDYIEKKALSKKDKKMNFVLYVIIGLLNIVISFILLMFQ